MTNVGDTRLSLDSDYVLSHLVSFKLSLLFLFVDAFSLKCVVITYKKMLSDHFCSLTTGM